MRSLWSEIEVAPSAAAAMGWRQRFGAGFDAVRTLCLRRTERQARSVPCPHGCACGHRVVSVGGGFVGVCQCDDGDCPDLQLAADDIAIWQIDPRSLCRAIVRAWGIPSASDQVPVPGVMQAGSFGGSMPVLLVMARDGGELRSSVGELVARLKGPFILLAPTTQFVNSAVQELLGSVKAGFFDLETHLTMTVAGTLQPRKSAGELFSVYLPEDRVGISGSEAKRFFDLRKKLRIEGQRQRKAPLNEVFDLLVIEDRTQEFVARECKCSPGLISKRVDQIETIMQRRLSELKALVLQLGEMEPPAKDERARRLYRKGLTDDTGDGDDDHG